MSVNINKLLLDYDNVCISINMVDLYNLNCKNKKSYKKKDRLIKNKVKLIEKISKYYDKFITIISNHNVINDELFISNRRYS